MSFFTACMRFVWVFVILLQALSVGAQGLQMGLGFPRDCPQAHRNSPSVLLLDSVLTKINQVSAAEIPQFKSPPSAEDPLFAQPDSIMALKISANFSLLFKKNFNESASGEIEFKDPQAGSRSLRVSMRQRGHQSRALPIKPLEVFVDSQTPNLSKTPFAQSGKSFDLVTDGKGKSLNFDSPENEDILQQYYAYRLSNIFNDPSLRVRLATITYFDTSSNSTIGVGLGIIREDKLALAKRVNLKKIPKKDGLAKGYVDVKDNFNYLRTELFEQMVGNIDYSFGRLKNLVGLETSDGPLFVPYDFGWVSALKKFERKKLLDSDVELPATVFFIHNYYSSYSDSQDQGASVDSVHKAVLDILRGQLAKRREAELLLEKLPFSQVQRLAARSRVDEYFAAAAKFIERYKTFDVFQAEVMNLEWLEQQRKNPRNVAGISRFNELSDRLEDESDFDYYLEDVSESSDPELIEEFYSR